MRKPNSICDVCGKTYYRRPRHHELYKSGHCSMKCRDVTIPRIEPRSCEHCGKEYVYKRKSQRFCSRHCAAKVTRGGGWSTIREDRSVRNRSQMRMRILRNRFSFDSCMVAGRGYNRTLDIHRLVIGRDGGKYEVGNMFAVCPNHHAEVHRKIGYFKKVSDCELRFFEGCPSQVKGPVC